MRYSYLSAIAVAAIAAGLSGQEPAYAERLAFKQCQALKSEQAALESSGVSDAMARGPEWALANLEPPKLVMIRRFIEVGEQLKFRCFNVKRTVKYKGRVIAVPPLPIRRPATASIRKSSTETATPPLPRRAPVARNVTGPIPENKAANDAARAAAKAAADAARSAQNAARAAARKPGAAK